MAKTDPRVDAYIDKAQPFAQPVLTHLRELVHNKLPDVEEAVKWGMPFFTLGGKNLANMAAFQRHAIFGFWEGLEIKTPKVGEAMGHFGCIRSLEDLPPDDEFSAIIQLAAEQLQKPKPAQRKSKKPVKVPPLPGDFAAAIAANGKAQSVWDDFAPSHKRDYIEWIAGAKREETRERRLTQALGWIAEGKDRNWKYRSC
ncbi:MAG: YdeI/OmpD-associated family protein [Sphingorhabdus sp.]